MRKNVSPMFAVIVILIAIAIGALSFLWRLRAYDAEQLRINKALQAEADAQRMTAIRNGTYGLMQSRSGARRAARRAAAGEKPGEPAPGGPMRAGARGRGPGAGGGSGPPGRREGSAESKVGPASAKPAAGESRK